MGRKGRLYYCPCCKKAVAQSVYEDHKDRHAKLLEADIAGLAILNSPVDSPVSTEGSTPEISHGRKQVQRTPSAAAPAGRKAATPTTSSAAEPSPPPPKHEAPPCDKEEQLALDIYRELRSMEIEIDRRYEALQTGPLHELSVPLDPLSMGRAERPMTRRQILANIENERLWMVDRIHRIQAYSRRLDEANSVFADSIIQALRERIDKIAVVVNPPCTRKPHTPVYDSSKHFEDPIHALAPATLVILMMAVVLNLLSNMTRGPCNFVLRMARLAVQAATSNTDSSDIPGDIRSARKRFNLDPVVTVYAVCSCGKLHAPTSTRPFAIYSATCDCGAELTKPTGHHNGVAIRKPLRPYAMQDFTDHRARLYSRRGYEAIMRRENALVSQAEGDFVTDIKEARAYRDLKGPDGQPFIDCPTEIRTVWSLSYDGYNPGTNKAAGKSASVGSLAMSCISLPPSLRNRPENLYLVGLIPGPKQPAADGLNPFLSPLIDVLLGSYHKGTFFTETYEHPEGITAREAVLPVITDLPGGRKLVGGAGHSAEIFCMYCHVLRTDINNIDMSTEAWRPKSGEAFRRAAEDWRDAPSKAKRKELYKQNGIRWSELLRLDYWDPVQNTVIDGMHNLFLNGVRHHFREVIGTHWDEKAAATTEAPPKEKDLKCGRRLLDRGEATLSRLERLGRPSLHRLCLERAVTPVALPGKKLHKRQLAVALMMGQGTIESNLMDEVHETRTHTLEETVVPDIFNIDLGEGSTRPTRQEMLDTNELKTIQEDIRRTLRPSSQTSPPNNFGSPSHGKLKADEWRASIEFDLPVSLTKLWADRRPSDAESDFKRKSLALESTFLLAIALRYATSHRTSASHREKYLEYMGKYLQSIMELHPDDKLHPSHHNALHIPTFLERFGPLHCWWMFPFERLIGILQKHKTNFKFGELEETVLKTFCAAAHLKNMLNQPPILSNPVTPPTILQQSLEIIEQCLPDSVKGTMRETLGSTGPTDSSKHTIKTLDKDIIEAFGDANLHRVPVKVFGRVQQNRCVFAPQSASRAHSTIFFRSSAQSALRPGTIREIFEYEGTTYLVVQCHETKHSTFFDRYPDFGAEVWSRKLQADPLIIPVSSSVYASYVREWEPSTLVLKPLIPAF